MRRDHARINIKKVAGLAAGNNSNCFALIIRSLRGGAGNKSNTIKNKTKMLCPSSILRLTGSTYGCQPVLIFDIILID